MIGWVRWRWACVKHLWWAFQWLSEDKRQVERCGRLLRDMYVDRVSSEKPRREDYR